MQGCRESWDEAWAPACGDSTHASSFSSKDAYSWLSFPRQGKEQKLPPSLWGSQPWNVACCCQGSKDTAEVFLQRTSGGGC